MAIKARDIRELCKGRVDPNVMKCMEALAEEQSVVKQQLLMMAQSIDQIIGIVSNMTIVAENMQNVAQKLQHKEGFTTGDPRDDDPI